MIKDNLNKYEVHKKLKEIKQEKLEKGLSVCYINPALINKYKIPYEFDLTSSKKGYKFDGRYISTELQDLYMRIKGLSKCPSIPASELVCHLFSCDKKMFDNVYSVYLFGSARDAYYYMVNADFECTVCTNLKNLCNQIYSKLQTILENHDKTSQSGYFGIY